MRPTTLSSIADLGELAEALTGLRAAAGAPSFAELARRVGALRLGRGSRDAPGKVTVYDCFRTDRHRVDAELIHDLVLALGASASAAAEWRTTAARLNGATLGGPVSASVLPAAEGSTSTGVEPAAAPVVVLTGLPGVGKAEYARRLAEVERRRTPGAVVLLVRLHGFEDGQRPAEADEVLRELVRAVGGRSDRRLDAAALRERLRTAARDRRIVVLLEDAFSAAQLAPLLIADHARGPAGCGLHLIVTSRARLDGLEALAAAEGLAVDRRTVLPLETEETVRRLSAATASRRPTSSSSDDAAVHRLAKAISGIRLDLDLVLRFIEDHPDWSLADVAERFGDRPRRDHAVPLLEPSVAAVGPDAATLFRRLGLLRGPVRLDVVETLLDDAGADAPTSVRLLRRLADMHLATVSERAVELHPLVHTAAHRLAVEQERPSVLVVLAGRVLDRFRELIGSVRFDASLADGLVAAAALAVDQRAGDALAAVVFDVVEPVGDAGYWSHAAELLQLAAPFVPRDRRGTTAELLARAFEKLGRYDDALDHLHRASRLLTEEQPGRTMNVIANVERQLGRMAEAEQSYLRAARIAAAAGNPITRGRAIGNLGNLSRITSRYRRSERLFDLADAVSARAGDDVNRTIVESNRVLLLQAQGRFDEALRRCATLLEHGGAGVNRGYLLTQRATILLDLDRVAEAEAALLAAGADDGGPTTFDEDAEIAIQLAQVARRRGDLVEAARLADTALASAERVGYPLLRSDACSTLGEIAADTDDAGTAERWARCSLELAELLGDRVEQARAFETIGRAAAIRGDRAAADAAFTTAADLLSAVGHWRATAVQTMRANLARA
ncbi:hypothetical protein SAMN06295909_0389 [Plantibacter sp. VKM Ac-1784]|uniref:AAA+ ATPase domain-containing protein n=1 Tax=Plantibacter elymi (nom. nud.) TaxID=199708 RepID=A0ABY1RAG4_9MICO|nr:hypothetical protein [Plantibacter sp. VKM Ac-1784]SMQ60040.1 hypothetical protein SAMN06295909_0389 [Plantibacter sp. VKM Ac-1784]